MREIDKFFLDKPEPLRSCLFAMRQYALGYAPEMREIWSYHMPFYTYKGRRICYIWIEKKSDRPYLGIVDGNRIEHPLLLAEKRSRMKIFLIDPTADLPIGSMDEILDLAVNVLVFK